MKTQAQALAWLLGLVVALQGRSDAATEYGKTVFLGDVSVGTWGAISNVSWSVGAGGVLQGPVTNYYRLCATNLKGRLPYSTNVVVSVTSTNATNAIVLTWLRYDGIAAYVVEMSTNAGASWPRWLVAGGAGAVTWTDTGSNTWQTNGPVSGLYAQIPGPSAPWDDQVLRDGSRSITGSIDVVGADINFQSGSVKSADEVEATLGSFSAIDSLNGTDPIQADDDLVPATSNAYDLGSAAYPWRHVYVGPNSVRYPGGYVGLHSGQLSDGLSWSESNQTLRANVTQPELDAAVASLPQSYISGCWVDYSNATKVAVLPGDGMCAGRYFAITSTVGHVVASLSGTPRRFSHVFVDYSESTFPSGVVLRDETNAPARVPAYGNGYYSSTVPQDRYLGCVFTTNGANTIYAFWRIANGGENRAYLWARRSSSYSIGAERITLASAMDPTGLWQEPDDANADAYTPVTANSALVMIVGTRSGNYTHSVVSPQELNAPGDSLSVTTDERNNTLWPALTWTATLRFATTRVPLLASRKLSVADEDGADNALSLYLYGFEEER